MRKFALAFLMLFALSLAACGGSSAADNGTSTPPAPTDTTAPAPAATDTPASTGGETAAATITMGSFNFADGASASIKVGQAVKFDDPSDSGGIHILVIGKNGQFAAKNGAPSEFNSSSGTMFNPGDSKIVTFPTAGTYTITCTIHPNMLATITVS